MTLLQQLCSLNNYDILLGEIQIERQDGNEGNGGIILESESKKLKVECILELQVPTRFNGKVTPHQHSFTISCFRLEPRGSNHPFTNLTSRLRDQTRPSLEINFSNQQEHKHFPRVGTAGIQQDNDATLALLLLTPWTITALVQTPWIQMLRALDQYDCSLFEFFQSQTLTEHLTYKHDKICEMTKPCFVHQINHPTPNKRMTIIRIDPLYVGRRFVPIQTHNTYSRCLTSLQTSTLRLGTSNGRPPHHARRQPPPR